METFKNNENLYKYMRLKEKMKVVKAENENYVKINELLQQELNQKSAALEASSRSFQALKVQYEELLQRLTEMHLTSFSSSVSSDINVKKESDEEIIRLKQIIETKDSRIEKLEAEIARLKNNDLFITEIYESIKLFKQKYVKTTEVQNESREKYITKSISELIQLLQVSEEKRLQSNRRIVSILKSCNKLTKLVSEERIRITQLMKQQNVQQNDDFLEREFQKLERFITKANRKYNIVYSEMY